MNCDVIKLLPDSVANQIAAGEVIQRPASVIKELVENSIDAGATAVEIIVKDAGRTLIQVVDNGKGMTPTDARMAFERHATSKITAADDLYALHTMGFRGEALPSIAAVAQIDLRTMQPGETVGTRLQLSESQFVSQEACACRAGTNMMVKNLFFHMPARRKFLKKDSVEMSHIMHEFERLALVNTDVEFTFISNDTTLFKLLRGSLKQRITALMGKAIGSQIIPIATETAIVKIDGFVGLPSHARRRNAPQYFFVNGRNMRHPYFHKAVTSCYADLIAADMQPIYFISLQVDPATIDVNIHPQKHEIKFENEQAIWQIITAAVKQALGRVNAAGAIDFDSDDIPDIPVFMPDADATMPGIATNDNYNPFADDADFPARTGFEIRSSINTADSPRQPRQAAPLSRPATQRVPDDWDRLYESFVRRSEGPAPSEPEPSAAASGHETETRADLSSPGTPALIDTTDSFSRHLSLNNKYIVLASREGLMIIDRHRAHMRVLYDRYLAEMQAAPRPSQKLLFPETVTLTPSQSTAMSAVSDLLERLGYDVSFLGDSVWAVNAVPSVRGNAVEALTRMVAELAESGEAPDDLTVKPLAKAMARSQALLPGQEITPEEDEALIAALLSSPEAAYSPDGLRTYTIIDNPSLSKLFH